MRNMASFLSSLKTNLAASQLDLKQNELTETWQISFSVDKSREMHTEKNNRNLVYLMLSTVMALTSQERDLGVTVATPLKSMALWETAGKKKKSTKSLVSSRKVLRTRQMALFCCSVKPLYM